MKCSDIILSDKSHPLIIETLLWWQGAQCSPLFLFTVSLHILIQRIALVLGFSSSYLKKNARNVFLHLTGTCNI